MSSSRSRGPEGRHPAHHEHGSHEHGSHEHGSHEHGSHEHGSHEHGEGEAEGSGHEQGSAGDAQPLQGADHDHSGHEHHGHGHHHGHHHDASGVALRSLVLALAITALFMIVEAVVGFTTGSLALIADAGHMLADAGALALALAAQNFAGRPRTQRSTFGYRRAEVLAAFVNGMALAGVAVLILKEAVERWFSPRPIDGHAILLTASIGLGVNLAVAAILMRGQKDNINVRAAFAHVLSDALGSVAAIAAGVAVVMWGMYRADPLLSAAIALLVAVSGFRILKEAAGILLEAAPEHLDVVAIERTIASTEGVMEVHDLHVWRISERFDALTAHVVIGRGHHGTDVCRGVAERLKAVHGLEHVTIQPEAPRPEDVVRLRRSRDGGPLRSSGKLRTGPGLV